MKGETPVFFKKVRKLGFAICTAAGSLTLIPGIQIPEPLSQITGYLITAGGVMILVSSLACENTQP